MVDEIGDDEYLLRHVPGGSRWQAAGPRITSANFQLRHDRNETGVSVTRSNITGPEKLMQMVGGSAEKASRIARVRVGDVRALGLTVVPKPIETMLDMLRFSLGPQAWMIMPVENNWPCDFSLLNQIEARHNLFPDLDYRVYA